MARVAVSREALLNHRLAGRSLAAGGIEMKLIARVCLLSAMSAVALSMLGCGGGGNPAVRSAGQWSGVWNNSATGAAGKATMAVAADHYPQETADCRCVDGSGKVWELLIAWNDRQGSGAPIVESVTVRVPGGSSYVPILQDFELYDAPAPRAGHFIIDFAPGAEGGLNGAYHVDLTR
jgi:hypothetical protein